MRRIGEILVEERPAPVPDKSEHIVKVLFCALCRTDAKIFVKGHRDLILPRVLGHEICGLDTESGRRVVVWPGVSCGICENCLDGRENLCEKIEILGFSRDGGLSEILCVSPGNMIPVPDRLDSSLAVLAEPFACAINAIEKLNLKSRAKLAIFGGGPLGHIIALIAASEKNAEIAIVEPDHWRAGSLEKMLTGKTASVVDSLEGFGKFDAAVTASSETGALLNAVSCLKLGGSLCFFSGLSGDGAVLEKNVFNEIHYKELAVMGAYGCTRKQMELALEIILRERVLAVNLISGTLPIEEAQNALHKISSGKGLKWLIQVQISC